ncbi:MazG family protein [Kutzneria viridogrisea]|uniref:Nucleoside-triphosphate pyrophosphatase n=2 Tax=Kutzneria TaxID=43356 RepID=W5VZ47_9PSEU|nr:MazG family protein [Kutzneria albida]AHH94173.1 nucleoside-triphosphate pyrophosphatase [Kutzneria albida DSM 43870]MBA8929846.1 XTP/dITP diphosphohydrolase [Kutzneria viridogrisea]
MTDQHNLVVLLDLRLGAVLPAAALPALRGASAVYAGSDLPEQVRLALGAEPVGATEQVLAAPGPVALISASLAEPTAAALHAAGAVVIGTEPPAGAALLDAVSVMDRLRSPGGCPWDAKQTHDSLRQYLVEETYELLDAIEQGDRQALREELGDVLLQVLFHARVAAEDPAPFDIDGVAQDLVDKLVGRHPHVFGDEVAEDDHHDRRWDELKQAEKRRESSVDGVALGQPAVSLAGKLASRTSKAGFPVDLLPDGEGAGVTLFLVAALARLAGEDPEGELRAVAKRFEREVRAAEQAAKQAGLDQTRLSADDWRRYWPAST